MNTLTGDPDNLKDVLLILETGAKAGLKLPLSETRRRLLDRADSGG